MMSILYSPRGNTDWLHQITSHCIEALYPIWWRKYCVFGKGWLTKNSCWCQSNFPNCHTGVQSTVKNRSNQRKNLGKGQKQMLWSPSTFSRSHFQEENTKTMPLSGVNIYMFDICQIFGKNIHSWLLCLREEHKAHR